MAPRPSSARHHRLHTKEQRRREFEQQERQIEAFGQEQAKKANPDGQ